jgi:hypothetical protein
MSDAQPKQQGVTDPAEDTSSAVADSQAPFRVGEHGLDPELERLLDQSGRTPPEDCGPAAPSAPSS